MKENGKRRQLRPWRAVLLGAMLPLALSTTAQTGLHWKQPEPASTQRVTLGASAPTPSRAYAGRIQRAQPPAPGFDVAAFERMAQQLTVGQRVPGLALAIVQNGRVLSARGYGVTDVAAPQAVDSHTVFRLASLSKAFAGTLTGLLVEDGALRWDSKIVDSVPSFRLNDPYATRQLSVADVLSHRTGLRAHNAFDRDIENNAAYYTVAQKLAGVPLGCAPGQCYAYQNVAFSLIGDVVHANTGMPYEREVERRLLRPLGMRDASLGLEGIQRSARWARPHVRSRNGWVSVSPKPTYYRLAPAAGVNASITDMAQWLLAHTGHRPDVLPPRLLATLHAPLISTPGEMRAGWRRDRIRSAGYALGWRVFDYAGHPLVFHAGAVEGYRGMVAMLPERDFGVALLWNSSSNLPSGLLPTILDSALGLPQHQWLDLPDEDDLLMADSTAPASSEEAQGGGANRATASPE